MLDRPVTEDLAGRTGEAGRRSPVDWALVIAIAVGLAVLSGIFFREIRSAVDVWNASTAYSHCYLVLPMTLYLIWERRGVFGRSPARPEPRWALLALPIGVAWLVAERLGIMEGRQLAAIAGVQVLLLTVLGRELYGRLSGPFLFLVFLVPFGAFLTPALQQFTAGFTIVGLDLLGIPNFSDKFTIETPAGVFFVAEACAGLRFLIAAVAFGVFFALLSYTSMVRRVAFILASIIIPIIANGFRALGIVVLGQVLGSAEAAAADHLIYGWIFFSAVMLVLIAVGQLFRDEMPASRLVARTASIRRGPAFWAVVSVLVPLGIGPAIAAMIDAGSSVPTIESAGLLEFGSGCSLVSRDDQGASGRSREVVTCGGTRFDVLVDAFPTRSTSSALVAERRRVTQEIGAEDATISGIAAPDDAGSWTVVQTTDPNRVTVYASWIDGMPARSGLAGRVAQARDSVFGADYAPILIAITTAEAQRVSPDSRKRTLEKLISLVDAQHGLNERVRNLSRVSGRGAS